MPTPSQRAVYDFLEVMIPGGFFCAVLMLIYHHSAATNLNEWTLGALGVFGLMAYAVGHLVQTLSNMIEVFYWRSVGGMPTDWLRSGKKNLLPEGKVRELEAHIRVKLRQPSTFKIKETEGGAWYYMCRQMHALVVENRPSQRVVHLEASYAINRGLACCVFALSVLYLLNDPFTSPVEIQDTDYNHLYLGTAIVLTGVLTLGRMQRFCVQYALELFAQFTLLPGPPIQLEQQVPIKTPTAELAQ
ncbi:MAG: hypothetical protein JWM80_1773 [Cyanobacteria bacterium RYN_339]|nr:hypothetical protein [Cyanobacteria bacterium RYN_339]